MARILIGLAVVALLAAAAWGLWPRHHAEHAMRESPDIAVATPLTTAMPGEKPFNAKCAVCHGQHAAGTRQGPPLVHRYYEPGHHSDMAFVLAVRRGVRAHHWRFGNMAPVPGVSDTEIRDIIDYVRALQRANGIY